MFQAEDLISGSRRLGGVSPDTARSDSAASRLSLDPVPTHRGRLEVSVVAAQYHRSPPTIQSSGYNPPVQVQLRPLLHHARVPDGAAAQGSGTHHRHRDIRK